MTDRLTVLLYGKSLFLDGIAAGLKDSSGMEVRRAGRTGDIPEKGSGPGKDSGADRPDVVLFDLDRTPSGILASYLTESPGPIVIGLSLTGNTAVLLSGQPRAVGTVSDLREVIAEQMGGKMRGVGMDAGPRLKTSGYKTEGP